MKKSDLEKLFKKYQTDELEFKGSCHDCGGKTSVIIADEVSGGAVYQPDPSEEKFFVKCDECFQKNPELNFYRDCHVYSRVVGYLQPVEKWNPGKQAEWKDRRMMEL